MTTEAVDETTSWIGSAETRRDLRGLARGVSILVVADLAVSLLLSVVLPETFFLDLYLDETYDQVVIDFRNAAAFVEPDDLVGWRMRPNAIDGNWSTDARGARELPVRIQHEGDQTDVLLLGSSVVNGGLRAAPDETLGAYLETDQIATANFGTMLYSLDQSVRAYTGRLSEMASDVVVVGIHAEPEAATNLFVPLRVRTEIYLPFLKSGARVEADTLRWIPVPPYDQGRRVEWPGMLGYLRENDSSFPSFESYRRLGVMPISSYVRELYLTLRPNLPGNDWVERGIDVDRRLMDGVVSEAAARGARVIFVKFPLLSDLIVPWHRALLTDINEAQDEMLRASPHEVVMVGELFRASGESLYSLYRDDGVHLTPAGYHLVADALRERILRATPIRN